MKITIRFLAAALLVLGATRVFAADVLVNGHWADADTVLVIPSRPLTLADAAEFARNGFAVQSVSLLNGTSRPADLLKNSPSRLSDDAVAFLTLRVPANRTLEQARAEAADLSGVESVWPNYRHEALFTPNDPYYPSYQSNFPQIGVNKAWDLSFGGGVTVAVIDSGYRSGLDDAATLVDQYDFWGHDENVQDFIGHGTLVANVIAEATNNGVGCAGIAPKSKIMPLKVFPDYDGGAYDGDIANAIDWARTHGAQIINMSLGGGDFSGVSNNAVNRAHDAGMLVFAASGNDGKGSVDYPAGYQNVIAIGSSQPRSGNEDPTRSSFSNYGNGLALVAPGEQIIQQTWGSDGIGYYGAYGTSVASPHAAGVAALLVSVVGPNTFDASDIAEAMFDTARSPVATWDETIGWGEVDAESAMEALGQIVPNDPPVAVIAVDKLTGRAPLTIKFSGTASSDPDGNIDSYSWSLPNLGLKEGPSIEYTFTESGRFDVLLTVSDTFGESDSTSVRIEVDPEVGDSGGNDENGCGGCSVADTGVAGFDARWPLVAASLAALIIRRKSRR